ncbi:MAG: nitronate monooxygenase [Spirochaetales bacterium]|nr:nitronate monooxygenase [Spirochaetales bacterium]
MEISNLFSHLKLPQVKFNRINLPKLDLSSINLSKMPKLKIGSSTAKLPIVQGGMGVGISLSNLAASVAEAGGIGVIAANSIGMLDPEYYAKNKDANSILLRREIRRAREKTDGIIGVNIMVAVDDFQDLLDVAIEEKADMVFLGAGLPIKGIPVERLRAADVKVVPIVSSGRAASLIFRSWARSYGDIPDGVVVEGPMAGGHLGFKPEQLDDPDFKLEILIPDVVEAVKPFMSQFSRNIPVIAAGGIFSGSDIHKFYRLGASGVQMGSRFVATEECDADVRFKEAYVACKKEDIGIIKSPVGMPGRAITGQFLKDAAAGKIKVKCAWKCLKSCDLKVSGYCISLALDNARKGILEQGFAFCGSNAYRIKKIVAVKSLLGELKSQYLLAEKRGIRSLWNEYEAALDNLFSIKSEHALILRNNLITMRDEYGKNFESKAALLREEYDRLAEKLVPLKLDYQKAASKANLLKDEISALFERQPVIKRFNRLKAF